MQTLDLECPTCGEHLELDAGFAGGVCRCSSCGTLMTVPRDAGTAEQLTAPDSDMDLSDPTLSPADISDAPRPRPRAGSSKRGKRGKGKARSGQSASTIDAGEYRTASGKVVRVDAPVRVPMAQSKRKKIRIATTVVFMSVVLGVAAVTGIVLWMMLTGGQTGQAADDASGGSGPVYDGTANPFEVEFANLAGLPLEGEVAVVIEASKGDSEYWMPEAASLIRSGLRSGGSSAEVAFFAAVQGETDSFEGGSPKPVAKIDQNKLGTWLEGLSFADSIDRTDAIKSALAGSPDMLILVFSGGTGAEIAAWKKLVDEEDDLVVHAVIIDSLSALAVQDWLGDREGSEVVSASSREIASWRDIAEDE